MINMEDPIGYMLHGINWPRMPKSFGRKTLAVVGLTSLLAGAIVSSEFKDQRIADSYSGLPKLEQPSNGGMIMPIPYSREIAPNIRTAPYEVDIHNGSGSIRIKIPGHSYGRKLGPFNQDISL